MKGLKPTYLILTIVLQLPKNGSSTHCPRTTDGPRSSLPWPAGHLEKNNYKRDEIKSNFNDARWPLSYTAVF